MVADEQELGVRVVHDVVNLLGHELVQDGNSHGAVGQRSQEGHGPLAAVAAAEGNLVALHHATVLEQNVQFLYLAGHIVELQGGAFVVGECIKVPVIDDALLY